jgi:hypothetical protein
MRYIHIAINHFAPPPGPVPFEKKVFLSQLGLKYAISGQEYSKNLRRWSQIC